MAYQNPQMFLIHQWIVSNSLLNQNKIYILIIFIVSFDIERNYQSVNMANELSGDFMIENPQFTIVTNQLDIDNTDSFTLDVVIWSFLNKFKIPFY